MTPVRLAAIIPFPVVADLPAPAVLGFALVLTGSVLCAISRRMRSRL